MTARSRAEALLELVDTDPAAVIASEEALDALGDDPAALAIAHRARALAYAHLEQLDRAIAAIDRALALRVDDDDVRGGVEMTAGALAVWAGDHRRGLAMLESAAARSSTASQAGVQLGASLYRLGRFGEALAALERARAGLAADDTAWWSRLETNMGLALAAVGRTTDAADALHRSIAHDESAGHARGVANGYLNLGWVACVAGDLPAAFEYYEEASARLGRAHSAELWRDRAEALLNAGFVDEAIAATRSAARSLAGAGHLTAATEATLRLAQALLLAGDDASAAVEGRRAAKEFRAQGRPAWAAYAEALAWSARARRRPESVEPAALIDVAAELEALGFASAAQQIRVEAVGVGVVRDEASSVSGLAAELVASRLRPQVMAAAWLAHARVLEALGHRRRALLAAGRGMTAIEDLSAALGAPEARAHATRNLAELGSLAVTMTRSSGRPRRIFDWIERARAGSLRLPRVVTGEVDPLVTELRVLEKAVIGTPPGRALDDLLRSRARLEGRIRHRARSLRGKESGAAAVRADEVLASLDPNEAVIALAHAGDDLVGVVLHRGRAVEVTAGSAAAWSGHLRRLLGTLDRTARRPGRAAAAALRTDLDGVELGFRIPASVESVIIVPPPDLYAFPWSMLLVGRAVAVAPSVTSALRAPVVIPDSVACVSGDGLRHAEEEARQVAALYPRAAVAAGSVEGALVALGSAAIGHLVSHGAFRADSPAFSSFDLTDGPLYLYELERLATPPSLVVLSACDLGAAAAVHGVEALGPVTSLIGAGASTVVASPVLVPDSVVSGDVMTAFHSAVVAGSRPARALALAKERVGVDAPYAVALGALQCHGRW